MPAMLAHRKFPSGLHMPQINGEAASRLELPSLPIALASAEIAAQHSLESSKPTRQRRSNDNDNLS
ncbi:hypothetical protein ColLi_05267 [Colletotrichum liriopes]|uniref:Uncharacterized protein n=1 Tax=Colletotrichum liriopes TaxID=708192 RepID=A0AA37GKL6_9PEZI|nr:hypothetical protein ColLi_05267 [Colletotrichum liriopes]